MRLAGRYGLGVTRTRTPIRLVCIGGGTGLAAVLRAVRPLASTPDDPHPTAPFRVTAITAVSDDGGSSGRLRRAFDVQPPGDMRQCLAALTESEELLCRLFSYRFSEGAALDGHSLGNLMLAVASRITGGMEGSLAELGRLMGARGRVIPATPDRCTLRALLRDGTHLEGESAIGQAPSPVEAVELCPAAPGASRSALAAIASADLITLGPGSLFTSLLPNLIVPEIAGALRRSTALKLLFLNLTSGPGETHGLTALDHLDAIERHAGRVVDVVAADDGISPDHPLAVDEDSLRRAGYGVVVESLRTPGYETRHSAPAVLRLLLDHAYQFAEAQ